MFAQLLFSVLWQIGIYCTSAHTLANIESMCMPLFARVCRHHISCTAAMQLDRLYTKFDCRYANFAFDFLFFILLVAFVMMKIVKKRTKKKNAKKIYMKNGINLSHSILDK